MTVADSRPMRSFLERSLWFLVASAGYILSPLSWWNDLYVNIPIAYLAAEIASRMDGALFLPVLTGCYWLTNIVGLLLLHMGARGAATGSIGRMSRPALLRWLAFSVLYTFVIVLCYAAGLIRPVAQYVSGRAPP